MHVGCKRIQLHAIAWDLPDAEFFTPSLRGNGLSGIRPSAQDIPGLRGKSAERFEPKSGGGGVPDRNLLGNVARANGLPRWHQPH